MTETIDFGAQTALIAHLAARTRDAQLDAPTPCTEYAVRNLLGHLMGLTAAFRDTAAKELGPSTGTSPGSALPDIAPGWRDELAARLDALATAWHRPAAWEGETQAGGITLPAALAGRIALNELVLHGWDLARATGRPYAPDTASLGVSYALLAPAAEDPDRGGMFGPAVPVPDDATLLDRVVALSGRRPDWTPAEG
ncbi:TIGR03086 family metal-binding protein [Streptomyces sp. NPDC014733]|uniref:TIGR03086 family metal-binding protein n=1 Tax=Streptomyces sp. NPDC014733 TaxID=3364885 RepID=UPI0036F84A1F